MEQQKLLDSPYSRTQTAILDLFAKVGRVPIASLAGMALDRGLIEDDVLRHCQMRGVTELCRRTLKTKKTAGGLPFAKPLGDEDGSWDQLVLFTRDELFEVIRRDMNAVTADYAEVRELVRYCRKRFGDAPDIPEFVVREVVVT